MNNTANRSAKPPVPKFHVTGAGTDTPDFSEPDTEATNLGAASVQAVPQNAKIALSIRDNKVNKKLSTLIEILEMQLGELTQFLDVEVVLKKSIELIKLLSDEDLKQKKYSSVTVAAIIHASRLTNQPVLMKQILMSLDCCEKQMKKVLALLNAHQSASVQEQVMVFIKATIKTLMLNDIFFDVCNLVYTTMDKRNIIAGEQDHVIAATIIKTANDILFRDKGFSLATIASHANCSEYSMKIMIKKVGPIIQEICEQLKKIYGK